MSKTKKVPKHIMTKIDRMGRLMQQLVDLNIEVEEWMQRNGISEPFDFTADYRDDRGYGISFPYDFVKAVEDAINGKTE